MAGGWLVLWTLVAALLPAAWVSAGECVIRNPTKRVYRDELVRLTMPPEQPDGAFVVLEDGRETSYQTEQTAGRRWVWVCADFEPESSRRYAMRPGAPRAAANRVVVRRDGPHWLLDNGHLAVKVPASADGADTPGPVSAVKAGDRWVAASRWNTSRRLKRYSAEVVGDGRLFGRMRLRYDFEGAAGLDGETAAFAEVEITLGPSWKHAAIRERHEMGRTDGWTLELSRGWSPREGRSRPFSAGPGSGDVKKLPAADRPLLPGALPYQPAELYIRLVPRWNQHYRDGWYFLATDGADCLGAVAVKAGAWLWPHDNVMDVVVNDSGQYAALRCPTWKGARMWWLTASMAAADTAYVARHAWESLDKLNHELILEWPGARGAFPSIGIYDGAQVNPTGGLRAMGRAAVAAAARTGDLSTLYRAQLMMHEDTFGSYWLYWSPQNPNFYTSFMKVPIALTCGLRTHPRFEELRRAAEMKLREDMDHSVTLPGGAGQECPGYLAYAVSQWDELANVCREHLGFDPTTWDRYRAARYFLKRISQPDGTRRRELPMGDTHPGPDGPKVVDVSPEEARAFVTEELPGFGVIFNSRSGTPRETYLAFKAGPNRGHYHGDQLAFHWCADAAPVAVDHHVSYSPRAGQEHMHNRVAFGTDAMPWANMDGYERLIAFRTSADADIAVGQVESGRLRQVERLPPEMWHQEYPQHALREPLVYRRTVVLVKGGERDWFAMRDEWRGGEDLRATYCLHVKSDRMERGGRRVDFGNATLFCADPADFEFEPFPWKHDKAGGEATQGVRLTVKGRSGQFVTVLYPGRAPAIELIEGGVRIGADEVLFGGEAIGEGPKGYAPLPGIDAVRSAGGKGGAEPSGAGARGGTSGTSPPGGLDGVALATVRRGGRIVAALSARDIDLNRSQGAIGLFVPDAGYPFGEMPDWLIRQRARRPGVSSGAWPAVPTAEAPIPSVSAHIFPARRSSAPRD